MNLQDFRDIKPPVYFISNYTFLFVALALLLLAVLIFVLLKLWKKWQESRPRVRLPKKTPYQIAFEALAELQAKGLLRLGKVREFYYELSDIIRRYLESQFSIKAAEMTTEEFLFSLKYSELLSASHKDLLREFLTLCDIVKFAKYGPDEGEIERSLIAAKKLIDETKTKAEA